MYTYGILWVLIVFGDEKKQNVFWFWFELSSKGWNHFKCVVQLCIIQSSYKRDE